MCWLEMISTLIEFTPQQVLETFHRAFATSDYILLHNYYFCVVMSTIIGGVVPRHPWAEGKSQTEKASGNLHAFEVPAVAQNT